MGFLSPAALTFSALAIPIIIFYMLRLRRQPLRVSSLLLWQKVLQDRRANAPWQRIRRNLLLLLQLLILLLIVLALARPFRTVEAGVQGNVILLIDDSASMQATDTPPDRLTAAKNKAVAVIRALHPGDTVSVIAVADLPQPLLTGDAVTNRRELETAIRDLPPTAAAANWDTALALAAASAASIPNSTVVVGMDAAEAAARKIRQLWRWQPATPATARNFLCGWKIFPMRRSSNCWKFRWTGNCSMRVQFRWRHTPPAAPR